MAVRHIVIGKGSIIMNNLLTTIPQLFTGKGGTLRLALCFAFLYETMNCGYSLRLNGKDGASFGQNLPFSHDVQGGSGKSLLSSSADSTSAE